MPAPTWICCSARTPGPAPKDTEGRRAACRRGPPSPRGWRGTAGGFAGRVTLTVPLGTAAGAGGPARRAVRAGPVHWLARYFLRSRGAEPGHDLVRHRDRRARARRRGRLRPPRTQKPPQTRRPGPPPGGAGFTFTPASRDGPPGGHGTWRLRTPGPGPDWIVVIDTLDTRDCPAPVREPGSRSGGQTEAPVPDPARHLHQPRLPAARCPMRLRAHHPPTRQVGGRACVMAARNAGTTTGSSSSPAGKSDSAPRRHLPLDHPGRTQLRHRTHPLPGLMSRELGRDDAPVGDGPVPDDHSGLGTEVVPCGVRRGA